MRLTYTFPLEWPPGWERTRSPKYSKFQVSLDTAIKDLAVELERLGATLPVLSSNLEYRQDGVLRARQTIYDSGVAVYFQLAGDSQVMACDDFRGVFENIRAISKTIEALRGIERWGGIAMKNRAFQGFRALSAGVRDPRAVLGISPTERDQTVMQKAYRTKLFETHPDRGGSSQAFIAVQDAARKLGLIP
jgi:hypothetical protein